MKKITIAKGDGIGPEIMDAVLDIFQAAQVPLEYETIEIGEKVYLEGHPSGIRPVAWESILQNKIFLKAPITTPQGGGYKSLNVTMRKTLGLFANIRPTQSYFPYVATNFPKMNVVIIRENEEDLYAGIEHQQTDEVVQCLKLISRPGSEKIIRYAFEYAKKYGRKKVTCLSKDNIMKQTDGLFHQVFREVAMEYPEIQSNHMIIDIGAARLAADPESFDVIVTSNLYGDIISDIAAEVAGSVGLAGSVNVGNSCTMFEAIHGSAPDIAGQDKANPSGLLQAGIAMLYHIGMSDKAQSIQDAWLKTIEDGIHTADIYSKENSKQLVGTKAFAQAIISNLGQKPVHLIATNPPTDSVISLPKLKHSTTKQKSLVGVDVFIHESNKNPDILAEKLLEVSNESGLILKMITNRGVKVWPNGLDETFCTDHWRCRFEISPDKPLSYLDVLQLQQAIFNHHIDIIKTENLYTFDDVAMYSMGQGQ
jgi:isocitrate dehydrogenase